jgi:hypothetical protein
MQLRLLQKACDLKVPVLLFLGRDGGKKLSWIKPVLEKVPDLLVVIDHMVRRPAVCGHVSCLNNVVPPSHS